MIIWIEINPLKSLINLPLSTDEYIQPAGGEDLLPTGNDNQ